MLQIFLVSLAIVALLSIIFEEITHINKAKTTLFLGCVAWITLFIDAGSREAEKLVEHRLDDNLLEIASLWLFLMSTMTFVAYLNAKGMVQTVVQRLFPAVVSVRMLMFQLALFALMLSSICDNVTATLVGLGLVQAFSLDKTTRLKMAVLVVFAVNSGGVALITGDVTTLMIFLDGHVEMSQLLLLLIPSTASVIVLASLFSLGAKGQVNIVPVQRQFTVIDILIAITFFTTILMTMAFNVLFGIPPVLTFMTGLSVMFLIGRKIHTDREEIRILEYVRQIEYDTLLFFLGILLLVGMLKEIGTLKLVAEFYADFAPLYSNYLVGAASALVDNVPLTAALLKATPALTTPQWLGLTYAVGVGGSLLVIGSAAGIIAMSKVKGLTFVAYLRYFPALLLAYSCGYALTMALSVNLYGS